MLSGIGTTATALLMADRCGGCPIAEKAIAYYVKDDAYHLSSLVDTADMNFTCKQDPTAAFCMYVGFELPWYWMLKKDGYFVDREPFIKIIEDYRKGDDDEQPER